MAPDLVVFPKDVPSDKLGAGMSRLSGSSVVEESSGLLVGYLR